MTTISQKERVYPYTFKYQGRERTLLWATCIEGDHFKMTKSNALYCANNVSDAKKEFAGLPFDIIWSEVATMDFDIFWNELNKLSQKIPTEAKVCEVILNGWNFIEDLLRTFSLDEAREKLNDSQVDKAYKKFFYGNNIKAVTPDDSSYNPLWEDDEIFILRERLTHVWKEIGQKTKLW